MRRTLAPFTPFGVVVVSVVAAWLGLAAAERIPVNPILGPVPVMAVIDGDTVVLDSSLGPRVVRLIGIDTPEVSHPEKGREPFGPEASAFTASLLPRGTQVWVELDLESEDAYGRLLAYLYLADDDGDWRIDGRPAVMVNERIARAGFARVLTIEPNGVYADYFEEAVAQARTDRIGMFGTAAGATVDDATVGDTDDPVLDMDEEVSVTGGASGGTASNVRIACILYDPSSDEDAGAEWVELRVLAPVETRGMALWDRGSRERFPLPVGRFEAGDVVRVDNPGKGVWNNGGDTVYLVFGSADVVLDVWTYEPVPGEDRVVCR